MTEDAASARLMWLTMGYQVTSVIHVAATIGVADPLRGGPAPPNEGAFAKFFDPHMLIALGAQERTGEESTALLDAAGFDLVAIHPAAMGLSVIEGAPR